MGCAARHLCGRLLALLVCLAAARPVFAQAVDAEVAAMHEELAKSLFAEGVKLSEEWRWSDAAERFERSLQLFPRSRTALNLAVALMRAGHPLRALEALDKYSALAADVPEEELQRSARLREQIESMTAHLSLEVFPVETELTVDQRVLPHQAKQWVVLEPGRHEVVARYRGQRRVLSLELKAGERVTQEIRWPSEPALAPAYHPGTLAPSIDAPAAAPVRAPPRRWKRWVWVGSGVLVAVGAAAVTTWALRRDTGSSTSCPPEEVCIR